MFDLTDRAARRGLIERAYRAGLTRVEPGEAVHRFLSRDGDRLLVENESVPVVGRLIVIAIGKAATPMAAAASEVVGDLLDTGYLLTKEAHAEEAPVPFEVFEAAHPVPDERAIAASRTILDGVRGLGPDDVVLALISGGGSALLTAPAGDLTLDDVQRTTTALLRAGAPIQDLNAVRTELSRVKGGGLRREIGAARTVSLILSDVLGNPPEIIASGPTVPRQPDPQRALDVLDRYRVRDAVPTAVLDRLGASRGREAEPGTSGGDIYRIIGDNESFVAAVEAFFTEQGLTAERVWHEQEGEARDRAREWVDLLVQARADVILGGGEMTVTVHGDGLGGRNTEFALAAAMQLDDRNVAGTVASLASDGQDGTIDAAGGVVDEFTVHDLRRTGIDPGDAIARSDSGGAFDRIGALIAPGPTGTNVNDIYIGLRHTN